MVELKTVDRDNFFDVIALRVGDNQTGFVAPNVRSVAETKVWPEYLPLAVYSGGELVGFVMYGVDEDDGELWLVRLMVDARFQGRGLGRQAMQAVLERAKESGRCRMYLSVEPENSGAVALYKSMGFAFDGRRIEGEDVMVCRW